MSLRQPKEGNKVASAVAKFREETSHSLRRVIGPRYEQLIKPRHVILGLHALAGFNVPFEIVGDFLPRCGLKRSDGRIDRFFYVQGDTPVGLYKGKGPLCVSVVLLPAVR